MKVIITKKGRRFRIRALENVGHLSRGEATAFQLYGCLDVKKEIGERLLKYGLGIKAEPKEPEIVTPEPPVTLAPEPPEVVTAEVVPEKTESAIDPPRTFRRAYRKGKEEDN